MRTWLRLGAAVAAAALLTTACGGGSGSAPQAGEDGLTPLRIAETAGAPLNFLTYGDEQGHFANAGIDLDISSSTGGATVIPQLMSGDLDVAGSNIVSGIIAISQGLPIQMVSAGSSTSEDPAQDFSALMVAPISTVTGIGQLAGQKVAVNSLRNINDIVLGNQLQQAGLSYDSVQFVEIPFPDMAPAIQRGDVAAGMLIEPFVTVAEGQGLKIIGRPYSDLRPGLQIGTYLMRQDLVRSDPDLVQRFQQAVKATADSIASDPQSFRNALPRISQTDPGLAEKVRINLWRGASDRESLQLVMDLMVQYKLIDAPVDLDQALAG
ncbi:ABC transporter substrate-binding protein [Pseudonocardia sp. CA-142604]|uniref:ABC transporter substrate-binding protein n=1 Tax=Pseudonocardia sp. CA-142604 TaxID=3240024 RepID=UPI003D8FE2D4